MRASDQIDGLRVAGARPSAMDLDQRQVILGWLGSEKGRAAIAEEGA